MGENSRATFHNQLISESLMPSLTKDHARAYNHPRIASHDSIGDIEPSENCYARGDGLPRGRQKAKWVPSVVTGFARHRTEPLLLLVHGALLPVATVTPFVTRAHSIAGSLLLLTAIAVSYWMGIRRKTRRQKRRAATSSRMSLHARSASCGRRGPRSSQAHARRVAPPRRLNVFP